MQQQNSNGSIPVVDPYSLTKHDRNGSSEHWKLLAALKKKLKLQDYWNQTLQKKAYSSCIEKQNSATQT